MAHQWRGVINEYRQWLPFTEEDPVTTPRQGRAPSVPAETPSARVGAQGYLRVDGASPTGSLTGRGLTAAVPRAVATGTAVVVCASTGTTSASAAAYAAKAGVAWAVVL